MLSAEGRKRVGSGQWAVGSWRLAVGGLVSAEC